MGIPQDGVSGRVDQVYKMIACLSYGVDITLLFRLRQFARETGQKYTFLWFVFV